MAQHAKVLPLVSCPYHRNPKAMGEKCVVADHARFFATVDDKITCRSQVEGYHTMNIHNFNVDYLLSSFSTVVSSLEAKKLDPNPNNLAVQCPNPASSGIWDANGNFNEDRFHQLSKKAIFDNGKEIITRQMVNDFLNDLHHGNLEVNNTAARVCGGLLSVSHKKVTYSSFNELFANFFDHWYRNEKGKFEPSFTVPHLRLWYTNSVAVFEMRMRGELPPPKPIAHNETYRPDIALLKLSFESKYVVTGCNTNTMTWIKLAVNKAILVNSLHFTSLDVKNFPKNDPHKETKEYFGIKFLQHDSRVPEDSYDYVGTATRVIVRLLNPMSFTDEESYFPNHNAATLAILQTFPPGSLPQADATWVHWESEQTFSNLIFCGLGMYYLTIARSRHRPPDAVYEVDFSGMTKYAVRPGFEAYGAIAYFAADRKCCGIMWSSKNRLVLPGDPDFQHAAVLFRSTLAVVSTAGEHLAYIHWTISNGLVLSAERFLNPLHPIRRLVKPHTFNAVAVNASSLNVLAPFSGISGRLFAIAESSWDNVFNDLIAAYKFESLEEHFAATGMDTSMKDQLPLYEDGIPLWNIIGDYVECYVDIHYPSEENLASDIEVAAYWDGLSHHLPNRDLGLGPINKASLVKQLSLSIFGVTAGHDYFGSLTQYALDCTGKLISTLVNYFIACINDAISLKIEPALPAKIRVGSLQGDIQTCFQSLALMCLTSPKMPKLIDDWSHIFKDQALPEGPKPAILKNLADWQDRLLEYSKVIERRNYSRPVPFRHMEPSILQVSVSV